MSGTSEFEKEIISKTFIEKVLHFDRLNSTNDYIRTVPEKDNVLVWTDYQTKGKGRFDRVWESEPNKNLMFSIKKIFKIRPENIFSLNFFFTYFILESILDYLCSRDSYINESDFNIKWPNDLMCNSRKFCGMLIESNIAKGEFIIGVGINVNQTQFSKEIDSRSTSLKKITGQSFELKRLLLQILIHISNNLRLLNEGELDEIFKKWNSKCKMKGNHVDYLDNGLIIQNAQVIDINKDGSIRIKNEGEIRDYFSGEIKILTN